MRRRGNVGETGVAVHICTCAEMKTHQCHIAIRDRKVAHLLTGKILALLTLI